MRTFLVVFCTLLAMTLTLHARKKLPASQQTATSKQHRSEMKKMAKARKAPKSHHRQKVN